MSRGDAGYNSGGLWGVESLNGLCPESVAITASLGINLHYNACFYSRLERGSGRSRFLAKVFFLHQRSEKDLERGLTTGFAVDFVFQ